jgi:ketosteroid isomerase-like protein
MKVEYSTDSERMINVLNQNTSILRIENQIRECEAQLYAAMLSSNVSELDRLIADDLLFAGPTGELATKAMDLDLHRTGGTQFHEFVPKELEIRVWSEHFVLALAKVFLRGTHLGNVFTGDYRYMRVWRKDKKGWRIVSGSTIAMG